MNDDFGSHATNPGDGVQMASGGGPCSSAANACMCTSMIGSRCWAAVEGQRRTANAEASAALMTAEYRLRFNRSL
jgi:hypothetical protein